MKTNFAVSTCVFFALLAKVACGAFNSDDAVVQETHDFGKALNDRVLKHVFTVRNEDDEPLTVQGTRTSCGCTSAELEPNPVPPGGTASLAVSLRLHGRNGTQEEHVTLVTDSIEAPNRRYKVTADAVPVILFEPGFLSFGRINGDRSETRDLVVDSLKQAAPKCQGFSKDNEAFSIQSIMKQSENEERRTAVYRIAVKEGLPPGIKRATLIFTTNDTPSGRYDVPVTAWILGDVLIAPKALRLRKGADNLIRFIRLTPGKIKKFQVQSVKLPDAVMTSEIDTFKDGSVLIRIKNLSGDPELHRKSITIGTDIPGKQEIEIPIHVFDPR